MNICLQSITKAFGKKVVLKNISVEFSFGGIYAIIGKNGAGKSTLFNIIGGLIEQDSGEILYDGHVYTQQPTALKQKIGFLSEQRAVLDELTGVQYLNFVGKLYNVDDLKFKIENLLHFFFEEGELNDHIIREYSNGMKKKLEICSTLIHDPELLILDEPFAGLDTMSVGKVIRYLETHFYDKNSTILLSSHQVGHIERLDPILILLHNHEICFWGNIEEFKEAFGHSIHEGLLSFYARSG